MTRTRSLVAVVVVLTCSLAGLDAAQRLAPNAATPAPLLATPASHEVGEMPGAAPVSMLIQHRGSLDDRLLGGHSPAAGRVELHTSDLNHGTRQMLPAPDGIVVPAGGTLILEPASGHLMLIDLRNDLIQGGSFPLTLHFAQAGDVTITVRVRRRVDAAGLTPIPPVIAGDLTIALASAPPATAR